MVTIVEWSSTPGCEPGDESSILSAHPKGKIQLNISYQNIKNSGDK